MESDVYMDVRFPPALVGPDGEDPFPHSLRQQVRESADVLKMFSDSAFFYLIQYKEYSPVQVHQMCDEEGVVGVYLDGELVFQTWVDEATQYGGPHVRIHAKWLKDMDDE